MTTALLFKECLIAVEATFSTPSKSPDFIGGCAETRVPVLRGLVAMLARNRVFI